MADYGSVVNDLLDEDPVSTTPDSSASGKDYGSVVDDLLNEEPVGGTFRPPEEPPIGAPTPAPPFPPYPGSYRGYVEPTADPPSMGTMYEATMVDDPLTKVKIFAAARGIPLSDIGKRYRYAKEGEIEFKADDGTWQREIAEHPIEQAKSLVTSFGHPAAIAGTAGAVVAGVPGAVGGAMAGEATRKTIGRTIYDEPQTVWGNLFDIGLEGLLALGGEMTGKVITAAVNRYLTRKAPRILKRAGAEIHGGQLTTQDHARAEYLKQLSEKHGIDLLPHQLYDKAGMRDMWIYLRKHPITANAIQQFDDALENETHRAIEGYIDYLGGYAEESYAMGSKLKAAASDAITEVEDARKAAARPYYEAAKDETPVVDIDRLKQELKFNEEKIAAGGPAQKPDVKTMIQEIQDSGSMVLIMRVKGEPELAYISRISKDYKRIVNKPVPMVAAEGGADIAQIKRRNEQIRDILAGAEPPEEMFPIPTKPPMVDVSEAVTKIDELMAETVPDDPSHKALKKIKKMIADARGSVKKLDRIKRSAMDSVLKKEKADPTLKYELQSVKKALTDAIDIQVPDYAAARGIYGKYGMAQPIEDLKLSVIGVLSQLEKVGDLENAVSKIFGTGRKVPSYEGIIRARKAVMGQDPELWNRAVAHHIREMHGAAQYAQSGEIINHAGKMHQSLFGSRNKQRAMAAAFGGENTSDYRAFKSLMEVLQRASTGKTGQSITHFAGEIKESITPKMGSKLYQFLSSPKQYMVDRTFSWWNDMLMRGRQEQLLQALVDPKIQAKIAMIKPLKPGSRRFIEAFTTMTALIATKIEAQTPPETAPGQTERPPIPQAAPQ